MYSRKRLNLLIDLRTQAQALMWCCHQLPQYNKYCHTWQTQNQYSGVISRSFMLSRDYPIFAYEQTGCFVKICQHNLPALNTVKKLGVWYENSHVIVNKL